jgi:uncharacterized membrane protein YedE/YeeE
MLEKLRSQKKFRLITALVVGLLFGFLLQKGGATDYEVLVNQLLLRDFTVLKIIFSAIVVGMPGVYLLVENNVADSSIKPFRPKSIITGGLIFGVGFALLGYCPGTLAGAVGTGSLHALIGALGMIIGAGTFASFYPLLSDFIAKDDRGEVTFPGLLGLSKGLVMVIVGVVLIVVMLLLEFGGF